MPLPQLQLWPTGKDRHKMWNCFRNGCRRVYCCKCAVRNHVKSSYIRLQQVRGRRAAKLNHRAFSFNRFAVAAFAVHSIFTAVNTFSYIFILLSTFSMFVPCWERANLYDSHGNTHDKVDHRSKYVEWHSQCIHRVLPTLDFWKMAA